MPLLLVLNELSYKHVRPHREAAASSITGLVALIRKIRRHRGDTVLVTEAGLFDLELADGYTMRQWAGDSRNRDALRYLRSVRQQAPFTGIVPEDLAGAAEYHHRGRPAVGLGTAHLLGTLGVSLLLAGEWNCPSVTLTRTALAEDSAGQVVVVEKPVRVRHAASADHVADHEGWLCDEGLAHVHTGAELWPLRADVFPDLVFLPRVESQMVDLDRAWVEPVKERLAELQTATARWDTSATPQPAWRSHVTPESQSRRSRCLFTDLDGTERLFESHARFTPGAGRIHFRVDRAKGKLVIAHIGRKL